MSPRELPDWLLSRGQHFITTDEVAELVGIRPSSVPVSLQRARDARRIVSVTKGGWVPVPPEFREAGAPPPLHFADALMRHLGHAYYIGLLSAAALHGASHQSPMVLQIVTPALLRNRTIGKGRIQFIRRSLTERRATEQINVPTGRIIVATPETTVLDIVEAPRHAGGLGNVATVVGELLIEGRLSDARLATAAAGYPTTVAQRTGHLVGHMATEVGVDLDLSRLLARVGGAQYTSLDPDSSEIGDRDPVWKVIASAPIEHDL